MLLDIVMPEVSGMEVLDRVRAFSSVPVIVFTARPDVASYAVRFGANDFIGKPLDPDKLVDKIRLVLSKQDGQQPQSGSAEGQGEPK